MATKLNPKAPVSYGQVKAVIDSLDDTRGYSVNQQPDVFARLLEERLFHIALETSEDHEAMEPDQARLLDLMLGIGLGFEIGRSLGQTEALEGLLGGEANGENEESA